MKLKLGPLAEDKPVKLTIELPASVHRDLVAYGEVLGRATGQTVSDPARLIVPMIERFMATDRAFVKARRNAPLNLASTQSTDRDSARAAVRETAQASDSHSLGANKPQD